jgi:hypothetical protein
MSKAFLLAMNASSLTIFGEVEPMSSCCVARRLFLFRTGKESSSD